MHQDKRVDIYNFEDVLAKAEQKVVNNPALSDSNKQKILEHEKYCHAKGLSKPRIIKYLSTLRIIGGMLNKDFSEATQDDILNLLIKINQTDHKEWTKHGYKIITKAFLKWLGKEKEAELIKAGRGPRCTKIPEQLITEQEILNMLYAAFNKRDRAFIACLYESGCRVGEIAGIRIKHVQLDRYGATIIVDGKTGMRPVNIVFSAPYLEDWIAEHPQRNNMDAPVWVCLDSGEPLVHSAIARILERIGKRAGVKKRIHPHIFRHSRATFLANHFTELQMDEYLGWVPGSSMPKTYVHLSQKNVKKALLELYGLSFPDSDKPVLIPIVCTACGKINAPTFDLCLRCGGNLRDTDYVVPVQSTGMCHEVIEVSDMASIQITSKK